MLVGARGDLRRMRHRHHLHLAGKPRQPRADRVRHRAADAGIDFVEHQRGRRAAIGQHDLERQQKARQLAAGGDLHHRARLGARIGLHPELDAVEALADRAILAIGLDLRHELGALELQRRQFGIDGLVEFFRRFCRAPRRVWSQPRCSACRPRQRLLQASSTDRRRHRSAPRRRHISRPALRGRRPASNICAKRRAARTAAPRCVQVRRDRNPLRPARR